MKVKLDYVLLIDDDEDDNYYHQLILNESFSIGTIKVAENCFEALCILANGNLVPDIIFLDANMPKMNGWEFIEKYENLYAGKRLKDPVIIMLSTSLSPKDKERASHIPLINGYETKPLTKEMFERIIKQYFAKQTAG
ncbi:MAG TPA: response regulator [Puia sp.]|jgi:CheY-like chemotaxis protein|nr:response regulator [Puia sp.]